MSQNQSVPPAVNRAMKFILRSPLHGIVSKTVLLLSFTGRMSGKRYTTPVSYSQTGDTVSIFTHAGWWKNLRGGAPVSLRIRGGEYQGIAQPIAENKAVVAAGLADHLRQVPSDARWYGVTFDQQGNPNAKEVENAVQSVVMVRIQCVSNGRTSAPAGLTPP